MARPPIPRRSPAWLRGARYAILAAVLLVVMFGYQINALYTDSLWFAELGQSAVFRTAVGTRILLFFGFGLLFFLLCYLNLWLAERLNAAHARPRVIDLEQEEFSRMVRRIAHWGALAGSAVLAFLVGGNAATHWDEYLQFTHAGRFDQQDPVFQNDIGFYVFRLPFFAYLQGWLLFTLFVTAVGTAAIYYSDRAVDLLAGSIPTIAPHARRHLLALLGALAVVYAVGLVLMRYDLLFSDHGTFYGAGYTDLHARLPALNLQVVFMLLTGLLCFVNIWTGRPFRLPLVGFAVWVAVTLLAGNIWPSAMERFTVVPNQFGMEKEYIARDMEFTRRAYGLDKVKEEKFSGTTRLAAADLAAERATIDNIRLWDWPQLALIYTVKQALRTYYRFDLPPGTSRTTSDYNIDVDRYDFGKGEQQVMLAARELSQDDLPPQARTWQNLRLQYTHGYGVVMSPVNEVDEEGLPTYYLSQIPVQSTIPGFNVERPQIYYGELTREHVFVATKQNEFDYPAGDVNKETRYTGKGGVPLAGMLRRIAWAIRLGDTNMLLSSDLTPESRILYRRSIRERVMTLAPFLNWDNDPYMVVDRDGGKLIWMMDAYTLTDRYPYSRPFTVGSRSAGRAQSFNYIRNSVKAVVDAYDGTVTFYVADPNDPILKTWSRIFPTLFTPMEKMPPTQRAHIRYPEDLFRIQRDIYTLYHISDPRVYYGREDVWEVPQDPTPSDDDSRPSFLPAQQQPRMMPYYVNMRLPGEPKSEFLIMTPYTPMQKPNMAAWLCARCDPDNYGQLLVYEFPKGSNVNGPQQIISQIKSREEISEKQTLLGMRGSKVIFGNLLAIPVKSSLLYAVPLYVQAEATGAALIPNINQVILASGDHIVMQPTLERAVAALAEGRAMARLTEPRSRRQDEGTRTTAASLPPDAPRPTPAPSGTASVPELVRRANAAYERARQRQREYDSALEELGGALKALERGLGSSPPR